MFFGCVMPMTLVLFEAIALVSAACNVDSIVSDTIVFVMSR